MRPTVGSRRQHPVGPPSVAPSPPRCDLPGVPFPVLLVECEEGVRTMGGLVGATADQLRMDMPLVVEFGPSPDGDLVPQWRPASA